MLSPSPIQLLPPNIVQLIVCHVVGSSRQVFASVLANSNEQNKLLKPLLRIGHNFCAIAYPLYCNHFKLELVGPEYDEGSIYNPLELIAELNKQAVYTGEALGALVHVPYEGCAFPLVCCITFHYKMYNPTEDDTPNPPESEANVSALAE
ncbi:hypothetical protein GGI13_005057 [Coemansia sp. RSA 455]|nr:hypothetical protein GGI13_005057 [Coemansia sp. RSA 455]